MPQQPGLTGAAPIVSRETSTKGGNLGVIRVDTPDGAIVPGGTVEVAIDVYNGAGGINPDDPDECGNPANTCAGTGATRGYCYQLRCNPDWTGQQFTDPDCINLAVVGANVVRRKFQFTAPDTEGNYVVEGSVIATGTESESPAETGSIAVRTEANGGTIDGGGVGDTAPENQNGGGGGGGFPDLGGLFAGGWKVLVIVAIILGLLLGNKVVDTVD